jgi:hypothetical protein
MTDTTELASMIAGKPIAADKSARLAALISGDDASYAAMKSAPKLEQQPAKPLVQRVIDALCGRGKKAEPERELTLTDHYASFNDIVDTAIIEARQNGCRPDALASRLEDHARRIRFGLAMRAPV